MQRRSPGQNGLNLGLLTDRLTTALQRELHRRLGPDAASLGPRHRAVMAYLDPAGSRATELAHRCGQHKQVIGTLVDDLERRGYVRREPDPADRRAKRVVPTDLGARYRCSADEAMVGIEQAIADALGQTRYEEFKQSFEQVTGLFGPD